MALRKVTSLPVSQSARLPNTHQKPAKREPAKREYNDFRKFIKDVNNEAIRLTAVKFMPSTEIDLTSLVEVIQAGKCQALSCLVLEGVKFVNTTVGVKPLKSLLETLGNVDREPNARLLSKFFTLDLSGLEVAATDADSLARLFTKFPELTLKLDNNSLGDDGAKILAQALKALENKAGHKIVLYLQNNNLTDTGLRSFLDIFDSKFFDFNIKWSIELGNRKKNGKKELQNKYSEEESSEIFQLIKLPKFILLFKGAKAIIKLDGVCALGMQVKMLFKSDSKSTAKSVVASPSTRSTPIAKAAQSVVMPSPSHRFFFDEQKKRKQQEDDEKQDYKTFAVIVQRMDGVPENEAINLGPISFDNGNSSIYGTRLHADYENRVNHAEAKASQDRLVIGYSHYGLPFQLLIKSHDESDLMLLFIKPYVIPLMAHYAAELSMANSHEDVIRRLIEEIYTMQNEHASATSFEMVVNIVFERGKSFYCAGFSIGSLRAILVSKRGQVSLVPAGKGLITKDAFNTDFFQERERVIERNHIFCTRVDRGEDLFICSALSDSLIAANNIIDINHLNREIPFFEAVKEANLHLFREKRERVERAGSTEEFGDDSSMGIVKVPTPNCQAFIKEFVRLDGLRWENKDPFPDLSDKCLLLINRIKLLKSAIDDEGLPDLTHMIKIINQAIQYPTHDSVKQLMLYSQSAQGSSSPLMKGFGIALMLVGVVLAAIGGFTMAGLLPVGGLGLLGGGLMLGGGVAIATFGMTLFLQGRKATGLAKELEETANECRKSLTTS